MITLERDDVDTYMLRASGDRPLIARLVGFNSKFHYERTFCGERHNERQALWFVPRDVIDRPILLDIRHSEWGRWYILHGLDFDHLQLTEVNQAMMDHLVAQPLFAAHTIGSFRLLDPDVDLPAERRRKRHSPEPEVIASPVDTSPRPPLVESRNPIFSGSIGVYQNVVLYEGAPTTLEGRRGRGRRRKEKPAASPKIEVLKPAAGRKFFNEN